MPSIDMQHHLVLDILTNAVQMMRVGDERVENALLDSATNVLMHLHRARHEMLPDDAINLDGVDEELWCIADIQF